MDKPWAGAVLNFDRVSRILWMRFLAFQTKAKKPQFASGELKITLQQAAGNALAIAVQKISFQIEVRAQIRTSFNAVKAILNFLLRRD
jgi:hypothetical protein